MKINILDPHVSVTMNVFLTIANIINLIYNIPQMVRTYKTKSTRDFSTWFILLRIVGNIIWIAYAIDINSIQMLVNNCVTVVASIFIGYYKCIELYDDYTGENHVIHKINYMELDNEIGTNEIGTNEIGANEIGTNEIDTNEIGTNEIGTNEIGTNEIGANEIGTNEMVSITIV